MWYFLDIGRIIVSLSWSTESRENYNYTLNTLVMRLFLKNMCNISYILPSVFGCITIDHSLSPLCLSSNTCISIHHSACFTFNYCFFNFLNYHPPHICLPILLYLTKALYLAITLSVCVSACPSMCTHIYLHCLPRMQRPCEGRVFQNREKLPEAWGCFPREPLSMAASSWYIVLSQGNCEGRESWRQEVWSLN